MHIAALQNSSFLPEIIISWSPYICHSVSRVMQTKNFSSFVPLRPTIRENILLWHILNLFSYNNCKCISGRKVRVRKNARKNMCFPICLNLLGCSSSLLSTHLSVIWCALPNKICHSAVLLMVHISLAISFNSVSLHTSLIFFLFLFLFVGASQLSSIDLLAASHFPHLKLPMFHWSLTLIYPLKDLCFSSQLLHILLKILNH